jgi:hypothetical protein
MPVKSTMQIPSVVVATMGLVSSAQGQNAVQWREEEGGNGHWYLPSTQVFSHFWAAQNHARSLGGHLATLTSPSENMWVAGLAAGDFILGGYQDRASASYSEPSGGWRWVTEEAWEFTSWSSGEPNNGGWPDDRGEHYLLWWRFHGWVFHERWNDGGNDMTIPPWNGPWNLRAIFEWSADCNEDGLVDYGQILDGTLADTDSNGIPDACDCPADLDRSGVIGAEDLAAVLFAWGTDGGKTPEADIDGDGTVGAEDLSVLIAAWGGCPG